MFRRTIPTLLLVLLVAGCTTSPQTNRVGATPPENTPDASPGVVASAFQTFDDCDDLLDYYIDHALDIVGPYGLGYHGPWYFAEGDMAAAEDNSGGDARAQAADGDFTGTNNQVVGVDEADVVKTDGERIITITDGRLTVWTVDDDGVTLTGSLSGPDLDWWPTSMLLDGDRLLLLGQAPAGGSGQRGGNDLASDSIGPVGSSVTRVAVVDIADPADPTVVETLDMDGWLVASRIVDGVARIALNSSPVGLAFEFPEGSGLRAEAEATERNRQIIRDSDLDNWLPFSVYQSASGDRQEGRLLDCSTVMAPNEFSGLETLSLLTFDVSEGLSEWSDAGVVATGATMYATADHTYLSTQRWMDWTRFTGADEVAEAANDHTTQIHLFDTSNPTAPTYLASGSVPGFLLNQFSMDEHDGHLRVATTSSPGGWWSDDSESQVTVMRRLGDTLAATGSVGGLGKTEQIYSVRFMGDVGYVVTFRQTDPLYVIDLADPTDPRTVGELKINGYSAYLHPVGDGRLLGVGQDATDDGRVTGTQVSLFDVSDPADPQRISQVMIEGAHSPVEWDHKAFTAIDGLALVPFEKWVWETADDARGVENGTFDSGVMAVRIEGEDLVLDEVLRPVADGPLSEKDIAPDVWSSMPQRTIVIGDRVFTITTGGIAVHDLTTLERIEFERSQ